MTTNQPSAAALRAARKIGLDRSTGAPAHGKPFTHIWADLIDAEYEELVAAVKSVIDYDLAFYDGCVDRGCISMKGINRIRTALAKLETP